MAADAGGHRLGAAFITTAVDARYRGQSHELTVAGVADFAEEHRRRNGYDLPDVPIEVVALRATAARPATLRPTDLPVVERPGARGAAVLAEEDCTIWVPAGWQARPGNAGSLVLRRR